MQNRNFFYVLSIIILFLFLYVWFLSAPADFPVGTIVKVEEGDSLRSVSLKLKTDHVIRSRVVFEAFVIIFGTDRRVISTNYYLEWKLPVYKVARRVSRGEHKMAPVAVTIPEGFNTIQIASTFASRLANFNEDKFLKEAQDLEGRLFPDTYFFLNTDNEVDVLKSMSENFNKKIKSLQPLIIKIGKSEKEIIIMASLIEGEAKGDVDRGFISGILWKRLSIGMPLQVDAAPETYKVKGLPKSPIGNPGLRAIEAAINPQKSSYLYYLHDKDGKIYYAKSFTEHRQNITKYLK